MNYQLSVPTVPNSVASSPSTVSLLLAAVLSGAVAAAVITGLVTVVLARRKSREEERARLRQAFADARRAQAAYKEFPYAIRRRAAERPVDERIRLSEALRDIQADIDFHLAWTELESDEVGRAYAELITQTRAVAGEAMKSAWQAAPVDTDEGMIVPRTTVDLSSLKPAEEAYTGAVQSHLRALAPGCSRPKP
jgi:type II secretory pathway pseudopilin PulG